MGCVSAVVQFPGGYDGPAPPPPPDEPEEIDAGCPVTFIGHRKGEFNFFDHVGQMRMLTAQHIGQRPQIMALFGKHGSWWLVEKFPAFNKDGKPTGQFSVSEVNAWIIDQSTRAGLFDKGMPERGVGMWRAGDVAVLHLGGALRWGDRWRRPGFREAGALWPAHPDTVTPADPAPPSTLRMLEVLLGRWNWAQPLAPAVLFGLWAAGLMGAAIPWRPHGFVAGEAGSGKSTLFEMLGEANPLALMVNSYTEAGLRQTLATHASAVLLDEADADDMAALERQQRVIGLLRLASGGKGAAVLKGGAGGDSQRFDVVASALMGGILPPVLLPQDASRITRLDVLRKAEGGPSLPNTAERAEVRRLGPAFLSRALFVLPRFPAAFAAAKAQLLALDGEAPRVADQIGAILAARWVMQNDEDLPDLSDEIDQLRWAIPSKEARQSEGGPQQCWHHLLHATLEIQRSEGRPTVLRTIAAALEMEPAPDTPRRALMDHGMRIGPYPLKDLGGPICLYVMNTHQQLARMFASTRWAGGKWAEDLSRLAGAIRPENPVKLMSGTKVRCVVIPPDLLPRKGTPGDSEDD